MGKGKTVRIRGKIVSGLGEARLFTGIEWVQEQCREKFGFTPYPGTLNLHVEGEANRKARRSVTKARGIMLEPAEAGFCAAMCFPVRVQDRWPGVMVVPMVEGYPEDKLEIIAPVRLKDVLPAADGDAVTVEVILPSP